MTESCPWAPRPSSLALGPGEVHLWRISLDRERTRVAERALLLSADERERMQRFRFDLHRERFALRRGALRILLGRYLGLEPRSLAFRAAERGKPELDPRRAPGPDAVAAGGRLQFNLSDSSDWALLGLTREERIGVDVEEARPLSDMDAIARDYFSAGEYAAYGLLLPAERPGGFFACWTRKEAWLKALGHGLAFPLRDFEVSLAPGEAPRLLSVRDQPGEPERWSLAACSPAPEYFGAVAVERPSIRLTCFDFEDIVR